MTDTSDSLNPIRTALEKILSAFPTSQLQEYGVYDALTALRTLETRHPSAPDTRLIEKLRREIWHEAQDSTFDTGFNEAKRQAIAIVRDFDASLSLKDPKTVNLDKPTIDGRDFEKGAAVCCGPSVSVSADASATRKDADSAAPANASDAPGMERNNCPNCGWWHPPSECPTAPAISVPHGPYPKPLPMPSVYETDTPARIWLAGHTWTDNQRMVTDSAPEYRRVDAPAKLPVYAPATGTWYEYDGEQWVPVSDAPAKQPLNSKPVEFDTFRQPFDLASEIPEVKLLQDWLRGRDEFIVSKGLWDEFVNGLPQPATSAASKGDGHG